jgi:hypothetical protein
MHLAKLTITKILSVLIVAFGLQHAVFAQENSPYSRYGLGDIVPKTNIVSRGMGGISAGYSDYQSVNFINPASYSNLRTTIFEFGAESGTRVLKSLSPAARYSSTNAVISYIQLAFPIKLKNANKKNIFMAMNMGLRPVSKINYRISETERLAGVDSIGKIFEGTGGINQAYIGTAISIKHFSLGVNGGYMFGNKDYGTQLTFKNDSVQYAMSNNQTKSNFAGLFINGGIQYEHRMRSKKTKRESVLRFGAYGNLKQSMTATRDVVAETILMDASGNKFRIDSVYEKNTNGTVIYPASLGMGVTYQTMNWLIGVDFERTRWQDYQFFGQSDLVQKSWKVRVGTEYYPLKDNTSFTKYFSFVKYRFGIYYGPDYIKVINTLPEFGFSFGAALPLKLRKSYYETQSSILNTAIEFGSRGDKNTNLRENTVRICLGLSLSDIWFGRAKYQ